MNFCVFFLFVTGVTVILTNFSRNFRVFCTIYENVSSKLSNMGAFVSLSLFIQKRALLFQLFVTGVTVTGVTVRPTVTLVTKWKKHYYIAWNLEYFNSSFQYWTQFNILKPTVPLVFKKQMTKELKIREN